MAALDFPGSPSNGDTYTANNLTYVYDSTDGVWNVQTSTVSFVREASGGLSTTTNVGVNTDVIDKGDIVGAGNSFNGIYVSNGFFLNDKVMTGNHYISTNYNAFCSGPITLMDVMTLDGSLTII